MVVGKFRLSTDFYIGLRMFFKVRVKLGLAVVFLLLGTACSQQEAQVITIERDLTITPTNAFTQLFLDSLQLAQFIEDGELEDSLTHLLYNFYNSRNYQLAWFTEDGVAEQTQAFYTLYQQYMTDIQDSSLVLPDALQTGMELMLFQDTTFTESSIPLLLDIELQLTRYFFGFVDRAYTGQMNPEDLQWHIPRKKVDAVALLDSLVVNKGKGLEEWEPVNSYYRRLKKALIHLYEVEKAHEWGEVALGKGEVFRIGDSSSVINEVKRKLRLTGDYVQGDTDGYFDSALHRAVVQYQFRMGLMEDGVIGQAVIRELNVPLKRRIEQVLINLERMRWMPDLQAGNGILVNIPQYRLHVFEDSELVMGMNIVVGTAASKTVIFNDMIKYVVFSPYWNVPRSIVRSEIVPGMERNSNYLAERNMEQMGFSNGLPVIRQRPGANNSLGRVKFIFPNSYAIYLHDTPARSLFGRERRALSHGCIRVEKPTELAEYLLSDSEEWGREEILRDMRSNKEKWVTLDNPMPVFIAYFTAWVGVDGLLNFREDIYGHDRKMSDRLFEKSGVQ